MVRPAQGFAAELPTRASRSRRRWCPSRRPNTVTFFENVGSSPHRRPRQGRTAVARPSASRTSVLGSAYDGPTSTRLGQDPRRDVFSAHPRCAVTCSTFNAGRSSRSSTLARFLLSHDAFRPRPCAFQRCADAMTAHSTHAYPARRRLHRRQGHAVILDSISTPAFGRQLAAGRAYLRCCCQYAPERPLDGIVYDMPVRPYARYRGSRPPGLSSERPESNDYGHSGLRAGRDIPRAATPNVHLRPRSGARSTGSAGRAAGIPRPNVAVRALRTTPPLETDRRRALNGGASAVRRSRPELIAEHWHAAFGAATRTRHIRALCDRFRVTSAALTAWSRAEGPLPPDRLRQRREGG